ncbi:hypothetical protein IWW45_007438 [Coemansia sp. RSA 485]|nr:hypothetical protein IWW45_007438 [Coemansia sp. RSA 485]
MDYRDHNGYFQEDVLRVLGRSGTLGSTASSASGGSASSSILGANDELLHQQYVPNPLVYQSLKEGNFSENDLSLSDVFGNSSSSSSTTTTTTDSSSPDRVDMDAEWEEVKNILYTTFVGLLLPVAFRYVGRRVTLSIWTKFLISYFK